MLPRSDHKTSKDAEALALECADAEELASAFAALSHATRINVLRLLSNAPSNGIAVGKIAVSLDLSPPAVSFHLKQLRSVGLVDEIRDGKWVICRLSAKALTELIIKFADGVLSTEMFLADLMALDCANTSSGHRFDEDWIEVGWRLAFIAKLRREYRDENLPEENAERGAEANPNPG
jgi:ArsR family transcriptional regulator